eukprot:scaffold2.g6833.t1
MAALCRAQPAPCFGRLGVCSSGCGYYEQAAAAGTAKVMPAHERLPRGAVQQAQLADILGVIHGAFFASDPRIHRVHEGLKGSTAYVNAYRELLARGRLWEHRRAPGGSGRHTHCTAAREAARGLERVTVCVVVAPPCGRSLLVRDSLRGGGAFLLPGGQLSAHMSSGDREAMGQFNLRGGAAQLHGVEAGSGPEVVEIAAAGLDVVAQCLVGDGVLRDPGTLPPELQQVAVLPPAAASAAPQPYLRTPANFARVMGRDALRELAGCHSFHGRHERPLLALQCCKLVRDYETGQAVAVDYWRSLTQQQQDEVAPRRRPRAQSWTVLRRVPRATARQRAELLARHPHVDLHMALHAAPVGRLLAAAVHHMPSGGQVAELSQAASAYCTAAAMEQEVAAARLTADERTALADAHNFIASLSDVLTQARADIASAADDPARHFAELRLATQHMLLHEHFEQRWIPAVDRMWVYLWQVPSGQGDVDGRRRRANQRLALHIASGNRCDDR